MKIYFYLSHTLYAKVLIPLMVRLADKGHSIYVSKNRFDFLRYDPRTCGGANIPNRFVNKNSFDYVSGIANSSCEWKRVRDSINFTFSLNPGRYDIIIGTTKDLCILESLHRRYPEKRIYAVGYQHMPFIISLKDDLTHKNLPEVCTDIFLKPNPFSARHRFPEYIAGHKVSFRGFPYLESICSGYNTRFPAGKAGCKRYVLIFHPGGYRNVITKRGEGKKRSYSRQREFLDSICRPVLREGLIPVIKVHPLAARHHFKEDILTILKSLSEDKSDFSKVIVEEDDYYKYVYESDTVVTFGSSSLYELFSIGMRNIIICAFFGDERAKRFSCMKEISIDSKMEYDNFWKREREHYFANIYRGNTLLSRIFLSYSTLFKKDISERILEDAGLS